MKILLCLYDVTRIVYTIVGICVDVCVSIMIVYAQKLSTTVISRKVSELGSLYSLNFLL